MEYATLKTRIIPESSTLDRKGAAESSDLPPLRQILCTSPRRAGTDQCAMSGLLSYTDLPCFLQSGDHRAMLIRDACGLLSVGAEGPNRIMICKTDGTKYCTPGTLLKLAGVSIMIVSTATFVGAAPV